MASGFLRMAMVTIWGMRENLSESATARFQKYTALYSRAIKFAKILSRMRVYINFNHTQERKIFPLLSITQQKPLFFAPCCVLQQRAKNGGRDSYPAFLHWPLQRPPAQDSDAPRQFPADVQPCCSNMSARRSNCSVPSEMARQLTVSRYDRNAWHIIRWLTVKQDTGGVKCTT